VSPSSIPSFSANTNYCFAPGTYSGFSHSIPTGDGWYGQGNAILDGGFASSEAIYNGGTASNVTIDGFTIQRYDYNCSSATYECNWPTTAYAINIQYGTNITVSDNTLTQLYDGGWLGDGGIALGGNASPCTFPSGITSVAIGANCYTYVENSTISHNVLNGIGLSGPAIGSGYNNSVNYNVVENTDEEGMDTEANIAAVGKFALVVKTNVIGNYISNNRENGIWFDVFDGDEIIENNTCVGTTTQQAAQSCIFLEETANAVVSNNTISNVGYSDANVPGGNNPGAAIRVSSSGAANDSTSMVYGLGGPNMPGPESITISNNTLSNNLEGVTLFDGHSTCSGACPVNNVNVTGNTITATTTAAYSSSCASGSYCGPTESDALVEVATSPEHNVTFSGNTLYLNSGKTAGFGLSGVLSWASWKGDGFDTSGSTCALIGGGSC
jgi:hypothetical protein